MLLVLIFAFSIDTINADAASLSSIKALAIGWGISIDVKNNSLVATKGIGGLDNRKSSLSASYKYTKDFTQSISFAGTLAGELSGTISGTKGKVSGGLGAKINSTTSIASSFTYKYTQDYSTTVPAKKNLTLYSDFYGKQITGYAKYFVGFITMKSGSLVVKIPQYQKFRAVTTS